MDNSTKNVLATGGVAILTSLGLFFMIKSVINGIQRRQNEQREEDLDASGEGGGSSQQEQIEQEQAKKYNPKADAEAIRKMLDGANIYEYSENIMEIFNKLSNAKLKKLHDYYKNKYKITLYKQMDDEYDLCGWTMNNNCYELPMKRLTNLNLR